MTRTRDEQTRESGKYIPLTAATCLISRGIASPVFRLGNSYWVRYE